MWENVGMGRTEESLKKAIDLIPKIRAEFWSNLRLPGNPGEFNVELEKAGRVADFLELGELIARDALNRRESCGGHFREEMQTEDGEAKRDDDNFAYVAAWEYNPNGDPILNKEPLEYKEVKLVQRNYK